MKTKIYIAKSNRSNPDIVQKVINILSKYKDIQILEQSNKLACNLTVIEKADFLIIIPNKMNEDEFSQNECGIPLRTSDEYRRFKSVNYTNFNSNTMVVTGANQYHISLTNIDDIGCADADDLINHEYLFLGKQDITLEVFLEDRLGYTPDLIKSESKIVKNSYHLLIS